MNRNNDNQSKARKAKMDKFYTQLVDIENELKHYRHHFQGKVVYCNCDDPRISGFAKYFTLNFERLGLKKVIATCYKNQQIDMFSKHDTEKAIYWEYNGQSSVHSENLKGDGDFRCDECKDLLKQADIVCTNPPFFITPQ